MDNGEKKTKKKKWIKEQRNVDNGKTKTKTKYGSRNRETWIKEKQKQKQKMDQGTEKRG